MPGVTSNPCYAASSQNIVLFADATYGQRITVFSVTDPSNPANFIPTLLINGAAPSSGTNTGPSTPPGGSWAITVNINQGGQPSNDIRTLNIAAGGSYLISA